MIQYYKLFGLGLASEFILSGMPIIESMGEPDVWIRSGKVERPHDGLPNTLYKPNSLANQSVYFLEVSDIARFLVKGKSEVQVEILEGGSEKDAMAFFFDTILTVILLKHNKFVFHASAVADDKGAIMICSHSGGGKSALAMSLMKQKYAFIEDDRCLLHWDETDQQIKIRNYLPYIDVWKDIQALAEKTKGLKLLYPIRENIQKFRYDAKAIAVEEAVPVRKLFLIAIDNLDDRIEKEVIRGMAKARIAKNFTHLAHLIPYVSDPRAHFAYLARMVTHIPVHRIRRSRLTKLDAFRAYIQQAIEKED